MDPEKPFKTVEVIDSRTSTVCKVACMSCIRGHRTTSCGIPVCRSKIFWTVKRPGRPSNSCNCRYGATGGCKCVVAKSACPHKSKKGEKRSGECRCEEQGRYCCLIDPRDWELLFALQKPTIQFYQTREALDARYMAATPMTAAPAHPVSPLPFGNLPSTPPQLLSPQSMQSESLYNGYQSPPAVLAPRFGMMGLGAPQGSEHAVTPNVLAWDGQSPLAPRELRQQSFETPEEPRSCCQGSAPPQQSVQYPPDLLSMQLVPQQPLDIGPFGGIPNVSMPFEPPLQPSFDFEKLQHAYQQYQFPSAICQTCGLNGCTCRNCPPVMQNSSNGSWAQCCGRKHARTAAYVAPTTQHTFQPQPQALQAISTLSGHDFSDQALFPDQSQTGELFSAEQLFASIPPYQDEHLGLHAPPQTQPRPGPVPDLPFDPGEAFAPPDGDTNLNLDDFLMSDLDPPSQGGCCCGDP